MGLKGDDKEREQEGERLTHTLNKQYMYLDVWTAG